MAFAVVAILGHFSKTLLLFFIPQTFNFILSSPQLFGLIPCPRHRVPKLRYVTLIPTVFTFIDTFGRLDGRLDPSTAEIENPSSLTILVLQVLHFFRLANVKISRDRRRAETTNLTLINFILTKTGPIKEYTLTRWVVIIQIACSMLAFFVRYGLASLVYDGDRR